METSSQIILALTFYKTASIAAGTAFAYMGYRLFMAGVWGNAGDIKATFNDNKLIVKQAAPGTFFVLFGTVVVSVALWKGIDMQYDGAVSEVESRAQIIEDKSNDLPDKPPF